MRLRKVTVNHIMAHASITVNGEYYREFCQERICKFRLIRCWKIRKIDRYCRQKLIVDLQVEFVQLGKKGVYRIQIAGY